MADLAISKNFDPTPNDINKIIDSFDGKAAVVQIRCDPDVEMLDPLLSSDVRAILSLFWDEDLKIRRKIMKT